jgi:hypothetical protein
MLQFEKWANVNFSQQLGKSTSETFQMIKQAYGEGQFRRWWAYRSAKNDQNWTQDPRSCNTGACQAPPNSRWNCSSTSRDEPWHLPQNSVWRRELVSCYPAVSHASWRKTKAIIAWALVVAWSTALYQRWKNCIPANDYLEGGRGYV